MANHAPTQRKRYAARKADGICPRCRKPVSRFALCGACRKRVQTYRKRKAREGMIIGLGFKKESGKDTAADALCANAGFQRASFSDFMFHEIIEHMPHFLPELYKLIMGIEPHGRGEIYDMLAHNPRHPAVRRLLQNWGTELRRAQDENYWVNKMITKLRLIPYRERRVVITNVRYASEFYGIKSNFDDVYMIRIDRPGLENFDTHTSDTEGEKLPWDVIIRNDGTIADLHASVLGQLSLWERSAR